MCSYAADQHHYQGIARETCVDPKTAVAATSIEWDFNSKTFNVKATNQSYDIPLGFMSQEIHDKLVGACNIENISGVEKRAIRIGGAASSAPRSFGNVVRSHNGRQTIGVRQ